MSAQERSHAAVLAERAASSWLQVPHSRGLPLAMVACRPAVPPAPPLPASRVQARAHAMASGPHKWALRQCLLALGLALIAGIPQPPPTPPPLPHLPLPHTHATSRPPRLRPLPAPSSHGWQAAPPASSSRAPRSSRAAGRCAAHASRRRRRRWGTRCTSTPSLRAFPPRLPSTPPRLLSKPSLHTSAPSYCRAASLRGRRARATPTPRPRTARARSAMGCSARPPSTCESWVGRRGASSLGPGVAARAGVVRGGGAVPALVMWRVREHSKGACGIL